LADTFHKLSVGLFDTESLDEMAEESACFTTVSANGDCVGLPFYTSVGCHLPVARGKQKNGLQIKKQFAASRMIELQK
jgi:hypothetical protein